MWKSPSDFCVCDVSVVVGVDAELKEYTVIRDVAECEETIVSQSRAILSTSSQDQTEQGLGDFNEILSPLGSETQLVVLSRANGIALFFTCMTLSAVMSLRHLWRTTELVKYETILQNSKRSSRNFLLSSQERQATLGLGATLVTSVSEDSLGR